MERYLVIAQLVERWTVVQLLSSIGHWFDSGSRDIFLLFYYFILVRTYVLCAVP
jgi:hypothetical protein